MSELDRLLHNYRMYLTTPWRDNLSGQEKVWFIVHSPANERRIRHRIQDFETETRSSGHGWKHVDITDSFSQWMNTDPQLRDGYFKRPHGLAANRLESFISDSIREKLRDSAESDVVAVSGVACLFGLTSLSEVLKQCEVDVKGRLVVFFPGTFEGTTYRLLDTSSGWTYLAIPITADSSSITY